MPDPTMALQDWLRGPGASFAAGCAVFYGVLKFFKEVEERLNADTKLEVAVWLLGLKAPPKLQVWPATFAKMFDRVFGSKQLSWKCFWRSCLASYSLLLVAAGYVVLKILLDEGRLVLDYALVRSLVIYGLVLNAVPDYLSMLETRYLLRLAARTESVMVIFPIIILDFLITATIPLVAVTILLVFLRADLLPHPKQFLAHAAEQWAASYVYFIGAFFASIWLWLYAGAAFLLKAARRLDIGFQWFNRRFDIEEKPVQAIGLMAGAVAALLYWGTAIAGAAASYLRTH